MVDRVDIRVKAGRGGDGASSFRHEKFIPFGGPDGGDGGKGGDVYLVATARIPDLERFKGQRFFEAEPGGRGAGQKMHGRNGKDVFIEVPLGVVVTFTGDVDHRFADLATEGQRVLVASGGAGGIGNERFKTPTHQAPEKTTPGRPGEERELVLELKVPIDVAIVGAPNSGKSALLAAVSGAKPKVADYPFTTTEVMMGMADVGNWRLVRGGEGPGGGLPAARGTGQGHPLPARRFLGLAGCGAGHTGRRIDCLWRRACREAAGYRRE